VTQYARPVLGKIQVFALFLGEAGSLVSYINQNCTIADAAFDQFTKAI
jgi:hypothetical protein